MFLGAWKVAGLAKREAREPGRGDGAMGVERVEGVEGVTRT